MSDPADLSNEIRETTIAHINEMTERLLELRAVRRRYVRALGARAARDAFKGLPEALRALRKAAR